ncbi:MAG: DNA repair exonuclease [Candidatus Thermoplasmatota archaeon]|nr:DNA repair exonuclease [Candidatus Thermoplasmatota archaeon]
MKILHIADTHLGFSAYRKSTTDGVNQREKDIYDSFTQVIDYALAEHVDLILHAGDLFDTVRPTNRAITVALQQILRLSAAQIPLVIIAGNHEQPKLQETGHIFSIFDHLDTVYPVYRETYEKHYFTIDDESICIHALPQINTVDLFQNQLENITKDNDADINILLFHGAVQGIKEFSMNEFNELFIPKRFLFSLFDYVALGHYHSYTKINNSAYYAGSIDALTFKDAGEKKGFIEITKDHDILRPEFKKLSNRPVINIPTIFCDSLSVEEIMDQITSAIRTIDPVGKIFRITLKDISSHQYRNLDFRSIRQYAQGSIHYELKVTFIDKENPFNDQQEKIDSLTKEYERFLTRTGAKEYKMLLENGLVYLERIEQELDAE